MVIAAAHTKLLIAGPDVAPHGLFPGKVHRRAAHREYTSRGQSPFAALGKKVRAEPERVAEDIAAAVAVKVEVAVVRKI